MFSEIAVPADLFKAEVSDRINRLAEYIEKLSLTQLSLSPHAKLLAGIARHELSCVGRPHDMLAIERLSAILWGGAGDAGGVCGVGSVFSAGNAVSAGGTGSTGSVGSAGGANSEEDEHSRDDGYAVRDKPDGEKDGQSIWGAWANGEDSEFLSFSNKLTLAGWFSNASFNKRGLLEQAVTDRCWQVAAYLGDMAAAGFFEEFDLPYSALLGKIHPDGKTVPRAQ